MRPVLRHVGADAFVPCQLAGLETLAAKDRAAFFQVCLRDGCVCQHTRADLVERRGKQVLRCWRVHCAEQCLVYLGGSLSRYHGLLGQRVG